MQQAFERELFSDKLREVNLALGFAKRGAAKGQTLQLLRLNPASTRLAQGITRAVMGGLKPQDGRSGAIPPPMSGAREGDRSTLPAIQWWMQPGQHRPSDPNGPSRLNDCLIDKGASLFLNKFLTDAAANSRERGLRAIA